MANVREGPPKATEAQFEAAARQFLLEKQEDMKERAVLGALAAVEAGIDQQAAEIEDPEDDDDYERIRARRKEQRKMQMQRKARFMAMGHGTYDEISTEREFFEATKRSPNCVVHFYRPTARFHPLVDRCIKVLSAAHCETRFLKCNVEKVPYLVERLNLWCMPSVVLVKERQTVHTIAGLEEVNGEGCTPEIFAAVMAGYEVIEKKE
jgi:hypothetical protein|tara:strand:+ start:300 stop:923 length:624 start_codon:yes stop_codon:yes gene_type:complete